MPLQNNIFAAMQLLEGKVASAAIKQQVKEQIDQRKKEGKKIPHLAAILVGSDGASETYVASKVKTCADLGFESTLLRFDENTTQHELLLKIQQLNEDDAIDGILVQLPLPAHIATELVIEAVHPDKDVDGFHPQNVGKLVSGLPTFISATPYGIMLLMEHYQISTSGKHAVVVGRSNIVGRPMSILMSSNLPIGNCTTTICHKGTVGLADYTRQADILITAVGRPGLIKADMVKEGVVIIDVGITRVTDTTNSRGYVIKGDIDFEDVAPKASFITPVPGGVGVMTIAGLMKNTLEACMRRNDSAGE